MKHQNPALLRRLALALPVVFSISLAACGGGGSDDQSTAEAMAAAPMSSAAAVSPGQKAAAASRSAKPAAAPKPALPAGVATTNTLQVQISIPGFPHKVDVYQPAGATKAIVFLHGLGGYSSQIAHDLGLNSVMSTPSMSTVNWTWLTQNGIIAIFPQGQIPAGSTSPTWSDYIQNSGADDVGFLKALSSYARTQFGATEVSLAGHSDGGAMTARIWCEATASYKAFVTLAGPMPSTTYPLPAPTCTPQTTAPYFAVVGGADTTLQRFLRTNATPTPNQISVGLTNPILVGEWSRHRDRATKVCGEVPQLTSTSTASYGPTWNACSTRVRYIVVSQADHPIASLEQFTGAKMVDWIKAFVQ